jgi:hypothetical protein
VVRDDKEALYRRLAHTRRIISEPIDTLTRERLAMFAEELEQQLKAIEASDASAPPSQVL